MIQLTKNFTVEEFLPEGVANTTEHNILKLHFLTHAILQPMRDSFGPLKISSGMRSVEHNAKIGGAPNSLHLYNGRDCAADVIVLGALTDVNKRLAVFSWLLSKCMYSIGELEWVTTTNHLHIGLPTARHTRRIFLKDDNGDFHSLPEDPVRAMNEIKRLDKRFANTLTA